MTIHLIFLCILLVANNLQGQAQPTKECIGISPESKIFITGRSNINTFNCSFDPSRLQASVDLEFTEDGNTIIFNDPKLELPVEGFDCGNTNINKDFRKLLNSEQFPQISIQLKMIELVKEENMEAVLLVTIAGKQNIYKIILPFDNNTFHGKFVVDITDFGLHPPKKFFGLITVEKEIEIKFNIITFR
jgi:hypothetical protein